jgi:hypothetical protein
MVLYSIEVKDGEEMKHRYDFEGDEFVYKRVTLTMSN